MGKSTEPLKTRQYVTAETLTNNLLLTYGCKFLNDNVICKMYNARLPVFLPNLNLTNCSNYLIVSA